MSLKEIELPSSCNIVEVEGEKTERNLFMFTLSTCQWCKKGKNWMNEKGFKFSYVDVDLIPRSDRTFIAEQLKKVFNMRVSYPFLVIDQETAFAGYKPQSWAEHLS